MRALQGLHCHWPIIQCRLLEAPSKRLQLGSVRAAIPTHGQLIKPTSQKQGYIPCLPGRRRALFATVATSLVFGLASALSPDYWWYVVMRGFTGADRHTHRCDAGSLSAAGSLHKICA